MLWHFKSIKIWNDLPSFVFNTKTLNPHFAHPHFVSHSKHHDGSSKVVPTRWPLRFCCDFTSETIDGLSISDQWYSAGARQSNTNSSSNASKQRIEVGARRMCTCIHQGPKSMPIRLQQLETIPNGHSGQPYSQSEFELYLASNE